MSFVETLDGLALKKSALVHRFEHLIASKSDQELETMARKSRALSLQNFGRTMRLFAPLYLSNECINNCRYCGFSRDNPILRVTLTVDQVVAEARHLAAQGFRQVLLVAGEHPKFVSSNYLGDCVRALTPFFSSIAIEVGPTTTNDYRSIVDLGAEGLVVYQETYNREVYSEMHTAGPKRDFNFRLDCVERGYAAGFGGLAFGALFAWCVGRVEGVGLVAILEFLWNHGWRAQISLRRRRFGGCFRRLGIGALFGLSRWQDEAVALAAHLEYLLKHCWQAQISLSLPRLRPAAGGFRPLFSMSDRELAQLVCALRITFPQVGIVLSTREHGALRDALMSLGVTMMSAGSHTEPGGYTHQGSEHLHRTVRGRIVAPDFQDGEDQLATGQFEISDERSPAEIAAVLRRRGFDPVWKDWDQALTSA